MDGVAARPATRGPGLFAGLMRGSDAAFVAWALLAGLLLRVAFLLVAIHFHRVQISWDEVLVAQNVVAGRGFTFDYYGRFPNPGPSAFFPPLYVFNVALILTLFHSVTAVAVQNVLLSVAVSFVLFVLTRRLFDGPTARVALLLSLVYPPFITRIPQALIHFRMLLVLLVVLAFQRMWSAEARRSHVVVAGVLAGLLALTMSDSLFYTGAVALALLVAAPRGLPRLRFAALLLAVTALVIAPWTIRNARAFGRVCVVSTNGGFMFYMGNHENATNEQDIESLVELDHRLDGTLGRADELEREHLLYREGFRWIASHPARALQSFTERAALHWIIRPSNLAEMGLAGEEGTRDWAFRFYLWSYALSYGVVLLLAVPGMWAQRARWRELLPVGLVFVYSTAIAAFFILQSKQRLVKVDALLVMFAAAGLVRLAARGARPSRPAAPAARVL